MTDAFRLVIGARSPPTQCRALGWFQASRAGPLMPLLRLRNAGKVTELLTELHHINSPGENIVSRQFTWCLAVRVLSQCDVVVSRNTAGTYFPVFYASSQHRIWHAGLGSSGRC